MAKQSHSPKDIWSVFRCKKKREAGFAPRFSTDDLDAGGTIGVRDKHIVHRTEVDTHHLCIADKHIACSCVEQNAMLFCF